MNKIVLVIAFITHLLPALDCMYALTLRARCFVCALHSLAQLQQQALNIAVTKPKRKN